MINSTVQVCSDGNDANRMIDLELLNIDFPLKMDEGLQ